MNPMVCFIRVFCPDPVLRFACATVTAKHLIREHQFTETMLYKPFKNFAKAIYYPLYRSAIRLRCRIEDYRPSANRSDIPLPPALLRFKVSETIPATDFLRVGEGCARHLVRILDSYCLHEHCRLSVLDFGCGCGRTIRWLKNNQQWQLYGCDIDAEGVSWCKSHLSSMTFATTPAMPPLPYSSDAFDVIYCISVFTHLNEDMQNAWLRELHRILTPNGVLIFTVHGKNAQGILNPSQKAALQDRGFLHLRSKKLKGIVPEWYQTTWHTQNYLDVQLTPLFEQISYHVIDDGIQDFVAMRKRY